MDPELKELKNFLEADVEVNKNKNFAWDDQKYVSKDLYKHL